MFTFPGLDNEARACTLGRERREMIKNIDLVATIGGRQPYNDSPLLMTALAIISNIIKG